MGVLEWPCVTVMFYVCVLLDGRLCDVLELRLLVFYVGYILDDKNTLCNGCNLKRMIIFYSESSCNMDSVHFKSCD
jgi:hypothetical protein